MPPRAPALPPDQRRASIIAAASPILLDDPSGFTTKQVAEAAGIAEGTVFRYFETKSDLVVAVIDELLDPGPLAAELQQLDQPDLEARALAILEVLRRNIDRVARVMAALTTHDHPRPTAHTLERHRQHAARMQRVDEAIATSLAPFADQLRFPTRTVAFHLRVLAMSTSRPMAAPPEISEDTSQLVAVLLHGVARPNHQEHS